MRFRSLLAGVRPGAPPPAPAPERSPTVPPGPILDHGNSPSFIAISPPPHILRLIFHTSGKYAYASVLTADDVTVTTMGTNAWALERQLYR